MTGDTPGTTPPGQPEAVILAMPADESWTPEQIAWFRERLKAAMANPGPPVVLPSDHWKDRAEAAEAKLAEVREVIKTFFTVHRNNTAASLTGARDLAEGLRQVLDRVPLGTQEHSGEKGVDRG